MKKEKVNEMMAEMYHTLLDPEEREKNRRIHEKKERIENLKLDVGL